MSQIKISKKINQRKKLAIARNRHGLRVRALRRGVNRQSIRYNTTILFY